MWIKRLHWQALVVITGLALLDLATNLALLNPGEPDMLTLLGFARGLVCYGAWPGNPYFPPGYPLLLIPFGYLGSMLVGGYLLSATGLWLALWSIYNLSSTLGLSRTGALLTVALCWLMPITRTVFSTPHVDPLFNGLAIWFIAAAVAYWHLYMDSPSRATADTPPAWVAAGLLVPALLLPLLRNHAFALVLPVLAVLACCRARWWRLLAASGGLFLAAVAFSLLSYWIAFGHAPAAIWQTYYRVGLELDFHRFYPTTESIGNNYQDLAERSRSVPLLEDYSLQQLATHAVKQFWLFFRRPAIALGIVLGILVPWLAPRLRLWHSLPSAIKPAAWWTLLYLLALCPAYFNARNGAPLAFIGMVIVVTITGMLVSDRLRRWAWILLCAAFLLFDVLYFPQNFYARHYWCHSASLAIAEYTRDRDLQYSDAVVDGIALIPLRDNPWGERFATVKIGWRNDPAIHAEQLAMIRQFDIDRLVRGEGELPELYICPQPPPFERNQRVTQSPYWILTDEVAGMGIFTNSSPVKSAAESTRGP